MRKPWILFVVVAQAMSACTTPGTLSSGGVPLTGQWGGVHVDLTLTGTGGTIAYDCAHGVLNAAVIPDAGGQFEVAGVHIREHGGPIRMGEPADSVPARYTGQVNRDRMKFRVFAGRDTLGPFDVQLGAAPQLVRCL